MRNLLTWVRRSFAKNSLERELDPPLQLPVTFRAYQPGDFDSLMEIYRLNAPGRFPAGDEQQFSTFLKETENGILVGELGGKPVSCAGLVGFGSEVFMFCHDLVHPQYQGKRIGSTMTLLRIVAAASKEKEDKPHYALLNAVPASIAFYHRFGFQDVGTWQATDGKEYPSAILRYYTSNARHIDGIFRWRKLFLKGEFLPAVSRKFVAKFVKNASGKADIKLVPITSGGPDNTASTGTPPQ